MTNLLSYHSRLSTNDEFLIIRRKDYIFGATFPSLRFLTSPQTGLYLSIIL